MSSHHVVREKQEPALLILELQEFHYDLLGQLLEWSPTVIVDEAAYEAVDSMGIKIDAVISKEPSSSLQHLTKIITSENSSLEAALKFLIGEGYSAVNIIVSHFILDDYLPFCSHINLVVLTPQQRIFPITSGFSKWKIANEGIKVLSDTKSLVFTGLRKIDDQNFCTMADGFYSFRFDEPFIFVAENI